MGQLSRFYMQLLNATEREVFQDSGGLRSRWLSLGNDSFILMIERAEPDSCVVGEDVVVFGIQPHAAEPMAAEAAALGTPVTHQTAFTLYLRDPDGRAIGLSSYPNKLVWRKT